MKYSELREYFAKYHLGKISRTELIVAIGLWQRGGACLDSHPIEIRHQSILQKKEGLTC